MKNLIDRKKYTTQINKFRDKPIIKVITGQRRVGKSFVVKSLIENLKKSKVSLKNIIYINKEDLKFDFIKDYRDLAKYIKKEATKAGKSRKIYLFIDEVQEIAGFEKAVRSFAIRDQFDIYITGSNSKIISSELATYLSGRYIEIHVSPLDYSEFLTFSNLPKDLDSLRKYLKYGGMPFIHRSELTEEMVYTYTKNIYNTILLKDVVEKFEIRNVQFLEKLVSFLCENIGYIFSANSISDYLKSEKIKIAPSVVIDYLEAVRSSYLVHEVKRYDLKGKKIFKTNSKFYINDIGIRNAIIGYSESSVNQLVENTVFMHLLSGGYKVYVGTLGEKEVDFVAIKDEKTAYIQVTLTIRNRETHKREFGNLIFIGDNYEKIVVSLDPITADYKGIKHYRLDDFLINFK
jgi:hypothetical protein